MNNLGGKTIDDKLYEEVEKLKRLMRGVKALKNSKLPQIHRIKGLIRFETICRVDKRFRSRNRDRNRQKGHKGILEASLR